VFDLLQMSSIGQSQNMAETANQKKNVKRGMIGKMVLDKNPSQRGPWTEPQLVLAEDSIN